MHRFGFQRVQKLVKPSELWGPALDKHRKLYLASIHAENSSFEVVQSLTSTDKSREIEMVDTTCNEKSGLHDV